jgi:hypothetical protein
MIIQMIIAMLTLVVKVPSVQPAEDLTFTMVRVVTSPESGVFIPVPTTSIAE